MGDQKRMFEKGFEALSEHVRKLIEEGVVMPDAINMPYHEGDKRIQLRLEISPVRYEDANSET